MTAGVALAACTADSILNPYKGQTPECPFHAVTGLWCPGCGSARAIHSLLRGDVAAAFARNPLLMVALPYVVWSWIAWTSDSMGGPHLWRLPHKRWVPITVLVVVGAFWIARNLPWPAFRVLGPG